MAPKRTTPNPFTDPAMVGMAKQLLGGLGDILLRGAVTTGLDRMTAMVTGEQHLLEHVARRIYESQAPAGKWERLAPDEKQRYARMATAALHALKDLSVPKFGGVR